MVSDAKGTSGGSRKRCSLRSPDQPGRFWAPEEFPVGFEGAVVDVHVLIRLRTDADEGQVTLEERLLSPSGGERWTREIGW